MPRRGGVSGHGGEIAARDMAGTQTRGKSRDLYRQRHLSSLSYGPHAHRSDNCRPAPAPFREVPVARKASPYPPGPLGRVCPPEVLSLAVGAALALGGIGARRVGLPWLGMV